MPDPFRIQNLVAGYVERLPGAVQNLDELVSRCAADAVTVCISGETVDQEGKRGFVLTLGTREQHIRREKATSNICTNQGLLALRGLVYLSALGPDGLREVAEGCLANSHYAAERIAAIPGWKPAFPGKPFFQEFAVDGPIPAADVIERLRKKRILPGVALSRWFPSMPNRLLVAATEVKTKKQIDALAKALADAK